MRNRLSLLLTVGLLAALAPSIRAAGETQTILDKAIQAMGGVAKLEKKAAQTQGKGTIDIAGGIHFTQTVTYQLPDKFKEVMDMDVNGQKVSVITVFDGQKAWVSVNGQNQDLGDKLLTEMKEAAHLIRISRLLDLKDKKYELSPLGEVQVDGKPAVGIKVSTKGFRDVNLYFDKKSGLPVKTERQTVDFMNNQEVSEERIINEYQDLDGTKIPKKVTVLRAGKKFTEVEVTDYKPLEKADDSEFAKP